MSFLDEFLNKPLPSNAVPVTEGVDDFDDSMDPIINAGDGDIDDDGDIDIPAEDPISDSLDKPESFELTPEEEAEADSIINIAATPVIMNQILDQETMKEFVASSEFDLAVEEGFALEGSQESFVQNCVFTEAQFYQQNMMRMTKQARTNQLFEICVQAIARAKNDPVYFKLAKAQQVRRKLKAILRQRYRGPAMKKAKEYIARMRNSKSKTISNAAKNVQ